MNDYQKSSDAVIALYHTDAKKGLKADQVIEHCRIHGANILPESASHSWLGIFLSQFQNPLIYILLIAALIIFFVSDDYHDAFIISGVLFFNAIIGAIQEGRTHSMLASLKRFIKTNSIVVRDGVKSVVEDTDLVVGDLIILQEGQRVPADARVIEAYNLQIDESTLTGESVARRKTSEAIAAPALLADRHNMIYKGTYIVSGSGKAIVVATGTATEIGKIQKTVEEISTEIPLRKELERLSYFILLFILLLCGLLLVVGLAMGRDFGQLLTMLTALFICVVPEGLPVVLTLVLVTGAYRMARQKVLVKNLQAVEALGRADIIITDKTGTLTRNEMMVLRVCTTRMTYTVTGNGYFTDGHVVAKNGISGAEDDNLLQIAIATSLLNAAEISYHVALGTFDIKGDPTDAALYVFSQKMRMNREELDVDYTKRYEIPFSSEHKYHTVFFVHGNEGIIYSVGAPETLFTHTSDLPAPITDCLKVFLQDGLRVIAVARKRVSLDAFPAATASMDEQLRIYTQLLKSDMEILGIVGIQDAIRSDVRSIVHKARDAGLSIIMATGDHQTTALYVGRATDVYQEGDDALDGAQLETMSDAQLMSSLTHTTVYSRVSPNQKLRIVQLFQRAGNIVAMTGDGINDAPSLVAADLGIAMGGIGTEVAKAAADMVLLDDSFVNIISAIEEGRHIFYTLRKVVLYFFATNMGEILIVLFALLAGLPLPITAAQILWLNLVTDGFLDAGLSMEPKEPNLLKKAEPGTQLSQQRLVDWSLIGKMMYMATPMAAGSLAIFWYYQADLVHARTMTLVTMALYQWFNAWNCRSETRSIFTLGLLKNKWLILATVFVLSLQFILLHVPFMQHMFKTVPLSLNDWLVMVAATLPMLIIEEVRKYVMYRGRTV